MFTFFQVNAQENWKLQKDKNGIKVYTKNHGMSSLKASKAEMTMETSVERVSEVLRDIPNYVNWTPKTETAKMLEVNSDNDFYYYSVIKAPMVSNRDLVAHVQIGETIDDVTIINMKGVANHIPEKEDLVRMPQYNGKYILKDLGDGTMHITLEYSSDPGGKLPDWLVNTAAVDVPYDIFTNLKTLF